MKTANDFARLISAVTLLMSCTLLVQAAGVKVEICHRPRGNTDNFRTITVSENAVPAHLAHGDFVGSCDNLASVICNDHNPCTIDEFLLGTTICNEEHPPVDCGDPCLASCDPTPITGGCKSDPIVCPVMEVCDSNTGECVISNIACPCFDSTDLAPIAPLFGGFACDNNGTLCTGINIDNTDCITIPGQGEGSVAVSTGESGLLSCVCAPDDPVNPSVTCQNVDDITEAEANICIDLILDRAGGTGEWPDCF